MVDLFKRWCLHLEQLYYIMECHEICNFTAIIKTWRKKILPNTLLIAEAMKTTQTANEKMKKVVVFCSDKTKSPESFKAIRVVVLNHFNATFKNFEAFYLYLSQSLNYFVQCRVYAKYFRFLVFPRTRPRTWSWSAHSSRITVQSSFLLD